MRRLKLLLPIMAATGTCAVAAPIITSCSNPIDQAVKNECLGMIEKSYQLAVGRNDDAREVCSKYKKNAYGYIEDAQSTNQILSIAYMYSSPDGDTSSGILQALCRQPESDKIMKQIESYSIKKTLSVTDERVIAIGKAAGGLAEAAGRQPEVFDMLFKDFKDFVEKTLGL